MRHHDDIHVPGLALIVTRLTLAHAEFLFPVPVKGLLARPAIMCHQQDPVHFPGRSIRHQFLACLLVAALVSEDHRADFVVDFRSSQRRREMPLPRDASADLLPVLDGNARRDRADALFHTLPDHLAVHLHAA